MVIFEKKIKYVKHFSRYLFFIFVLFFSYQAAGQDICQGDANDLSIDDLSLTWTQPLKLRTVTASLL